MKIKSLFKNRRFSLDGLIEVAVTLVGFIGILAAFATLYWLIDSYPAETGASILCIALLTAVGYILGGIINTIFPKKDSDVEEWVESAKEEIKKIQDPDRLDVIREKKEKLEDDLKKAEQEYMEEWAKKGITPEQMAWLHNWFGDMNKNISEGVLWKRKDVVHESN
jgi:hypothetical protein